MQQPHAEHTGPRWAIASGLRRLWLSIQQSRGQLEHGSWRRWLVTLVVGFTLCCALSYVLAKAGHRLAPRGLDEWDRRTLTWIERHGPLSFPDAILIESPGNLAYLIPVTAAVAVLALLKRRPVFAATIVASYVLMRLIVLVGWLTLDRPRPRLIADGIAAPPLHSFPSGHIALALSVYGLLAYLWWERSRSGAERVIIVLVTLAWCGVVGVARVRLGSHWPSDVIAGAILGVAWLPCAVLALRRAEVRAA